MSKDRANLSKELTDVQVSRWRGFEALARTLKNRHILGVELFRTLDDETVAIITISRNGEPARFLLKADAHGRVKQVECHPRAIDDGQPPMHALMATAAADGGSDSPSIVSMGHPPPTEPTSPGVTAVLEGMLTDAFNVA